MHTYVQNFVFGNVALHIRCRLSPISPFNFKIAFVSKCAARCHGWYLFILNFNFLIGPFLNKTLVITIESDQFNAFSYTANTANTNDDLKVDFRDFTLRSLDGIVCHYKTRFDSI